MKNAKTILFGILVIAVTLSALVAPATAKFVHPRGMMITIYPQDIVVFWGRPGTYDKTLALIIKPPWYFVEDLMGFDSVTLTITLSPVCLMCRQPSAPSENPPTLVGANSAGKLVIQWSNVQMSEEDNGMLILVPISFEISAATSRGHYFLFLSAEAQASSATFYGWDQVIVSVCP